MANEANKQAARLVERDVLDWLGLLPDSDPPNDEPDYERRLRALGKALHEKDWTGPECLAALTLHLASQEVVSLDALGLVKFLGTAARNLASLEGSTAELGQSLVASLQAGGEAA